MKEIVEALALLEQETDAHWTTTGLPAMSIIHAITGNLELTRKDVTAVAPEFTRVNPKLPTIKADVALSDEIPEDVKQDDTANLEAERLKQKIIVEKTETHVPEHTINQLGLMAVIARSQQDRAERGQASRLDSRLRMKNRMARRQGVSK